MKRWMKTATTALTALALLAPTAAQAAPAVDGLRDTAVLQEALAQQDSDTGLSSTTLESGADTGLSQDELQAAAHYGVQQHTGTAKSASTNVVSSYSNADDASGTSDSSTAIANSLQDNPGIGIGIGTVPDATTPDPLDFDSIQQDDPFADLPWYARNNWLDSTTNTITLPGPQEGGTSAGAIPEGLEKFYSQKIDWQYDGYVTFGKPASNGAEVSVSMQTAYVAVPLDYSDPDNGKTVELFVRKVHYSFSDGDDDKYGTVIVNPGGPGASGADYAGHIEWYDDGSAMIYYAGSYDLFRHYDIIGFDTRGTGNSLPKLMCQSNQARDWQREGSDTLTNDQLDQINRYNVEQCYSNTAKGYNNLTAEEFIPTTNTAVTARDMDLIRSATGSDKLTYMGASYGTRLGYYYAMQFPRNVRAMVLDGDENIFDKNEDMAKSARYTAYNPNIAESRGESQYKSFNETFKQFLKWCLTTSDISSCAVGDHVDGTPTDAQINAAYARYQSIARRTWGGIDAGLSDGRVLSFSDFTWGTTEAMYSKSSWSSLNDALASFDKSGDGTGIMSLSDEYMHRDEDGTYEPQETAFEVIYAQDNSKPSDPAGYTDSEREEDMRKLYAECPYLDPGVDESGNQRGLNTAADESDFFTTGGLLEPVYEMSTLPNILVISSTYDPATPYENGIVTARALRGTLLVAGNSQHCAYHTVDCAANVANSYFYDPDGFTVSIDNGTYQGQAVTRGIGNASVSSRDFVADGQCRLVSFRPASGDTVVKATGDQLTDGPDGNKRNVELSSTAKDGETDATAEGTSISIKSSYSDDVKNAEQGDRLRIYLNDMTTDCAQPNAGCTYTPYLYSTDAGSTPIGMGDISEASTDADGAYYITTTVPDTVYVGDYKVAVYRENGWLYGWTTLTVTGTPADAPESVALHRLYNPNSGEHFYTADANEYAYLAGAGWNDEGVGWYALLSGTPVYRLYNPNAGDHHYTVDVAERDALVSAGWNDEGVGWYSASASGGHPVFRQYNPNAATGTHNYTLDGYERDTLMSFGWRNERVAWYGI